MPRPRVFHPKKKDVKFYSTTVNQRGHSVTKNGEALAWVVTHINHDAPFQVAIDVDGNIDIRPNGWTIKIVEPSDAKG